MKDIRKKFKVGNKVKLVRLTDGEKEMKRYQQNLGKIFTIREISNYKSGFFCKFKENPAIFPDLTDLELVNNQEQEKKVTLKVGDILTYRNGNQYIISGDKDLKLLLEEYSEGLRYFCDGFVNPAQDIMKVQRYVLVEFLMCIRAEENNSTDHNYYNLETIYEREEKEEILDTEEKEYLKAVIRPYGRDTEIKKETFEHYEYISIKIIQDKVGYKNFHKIELPVFPKGTMYKGMEADKLYSLKELGLDD